MSIFSKAKPFERNTSTSTASPQTEAPDVVVPHEIGELAHARQCLESFNSELQDSHSRQQAAMKRVSTLNKIISKMELDMKLLRRLEMENKNQSRTVLELESKLSQKSTWASELDSKLNELDRRHSDVRERLDTAQSELAASRDHSKELGIEVAEQERIIRSLTVRAESSEDKARHAEHSLEKLRDSVDTQATQIGSRNREVVELQNGLDELKEKYDRKSKASDATLVELKNLRLDYNELKTKHVELTGHLENTKYDLRTRKNVFDDTIKRREEENLALKTSIDQLETQVRIKENMASHLDQEFITLRNELLNERDRTAALEQRLQKKTEEMERTGASLVKSKIEYEDLNARFSATLEDFETMRKINQLQREKLERYASIGGVSGGQVMLNMDVTPVEDDVTRSVAEDAENVTVLKPAKKPRK